MMSRSIDNTPAYPGKDNVMLKRNNRGITAQMAGEGAHNATCKSLIGEPEGAPRFFMRLFEIGPGGNTPHHTHEWEHEIFILNGTGKVVGETDMIPFASGDALFIPGGEIHHLENTGANMLRFLCIIPKMP